MLWGQTVVTLGCIHLFDSVWAAPLYSPGACSPNKAGDWRYVPRGYSPLITHVCPPFRLSIVYVWMRIFPNYAPLVSNFPHSCRMKVFWRSPRPLEITNIKKQVLSLSDTDVTKWGSVNVFPMLQDTKPLGHLSAVTPSVINPSSHSRHLHNFLACSHSANEQVPRYGPRKLDAMLLKRPARRPFEPVHVSTRNFSKTSFKINPPIRAHRPLGNLRVPVHLPLSV